MPRFASLVLLGLAACAASDAVQPTAGMPPLMEGWQASSGKPLTKAEFAAVVAACQDRAANARPSAVDDCLVQFGLRRVP